MTNLGREIYLSEQNCFNIIVSILLKFNIEIPNCVHLI